MELPKNVQDNFEHITQIMRDVLASEGMVRPTAFISTMQGNMVVPCDLPDSKMLARFLRFLVRDSEADWIMLVLDTTVFNHTTGRQKRNIVWVLETQTGGHWTAQSEVITKNKVKTFGDVQLEFTKLMSGDIAGLFTPQGKVN